MCSASFHMKTLKMKVAGRENKTGVVFTYERPTKRRLNMRRSAYGRTAACHVGTLSCSTLPLRIGRITENDAVGHT